MLSRLPYKNRLKWNAVFSSLLFIFLRVATLHTQQNKWAEIKLYLVLLKFDEFISLAQVVVVVIAARSSRPINNIPTTLKRWADDWLMISRWISFHEWKKCAIYDERWQFIQKATALVHNSSDTMGPRRRELSWILRPLVGRFTSRLWPPEDFWSFWMCWPLDQITMLSKKILGRTNSKLINVDKPYRISIFTSSHSLSSLLIVP